MHHIELEKAQDRLPELIDEVLDGKEVVITHRALPVAKLVDVQRPAHTQQPRQPGSAKGLIEIGEDFDEPLEEFRDYL